MAIIWRPAAEFAPKPFKVNELQACTPCSGSGAKVQVQRDTLLEDFKLLLKDFYLRICTPEQLKLEQRAHSKPKRYFNGKIDEQEEQPEKRKKQEQQEKPEKGEKQKQEQKPEKRKKQKQQEKPEKGNKQKQELKTEKGKKQKQRAPALAVAGKGAKRRLIKSKALSALS